MRLASKTPGRISLSVDVDEVRLRRRKARDVRAPCVVDEQMRARRAERDGDPAPGGVAVSVRNGGEGRPGRRFAAAALRFDTLVGRGGWRLLSVPDPLPAASPAVGWSFTFSTRAPSTDKGSFASHVGCVALGVERPTHQVPRGRCF